MQRAMAWKLANKYAESTGVTLEEVMQIIHDGTTYRASLITGPTHNTLVVVFAPDASAPHPTITALPAIGTCTHGTLDEVVILHDVLAGIAQVNDEQHTQYHVEAIHYIINDTPRPVIYKVLAVAIARYRMQQEATKRTRDAGED